MFADRDHICLTEESIVARNLENTMKNLLIIDDDEMMLSALTICFQGDGYEVVTALDGPEGIELYNKHHPSVVLLDLNMPTMRGLEVLDRIKKNDPSAKIIIITGYASPEVLEESTRKGAFAFYDKTMDVDILRGYVERAVEIGRNVLNLPIEHNPDY